VVNPDWGIKRTCHSCGAKYYDFKKKTPACPSCGTAFDPEALLKSRRRAMPEEKVKPIEKVEDIEVEDADDILNELLEHLTETSGWCVDNVLYNICE
jgi:uncharacterized protein (TIGR02300 family)